MWRAVLTWLSNLLTGIGYVKATSIGWYGKHERRSGPPPSKVTVTNQMIDNDRFTKGWQFRRFAELRPKLTVTPGLIGSVVFMSILFVACTLSATMMAGILWVIVFD